MGANTFGRRFALTTFGESHGPAIGGVVDGCPAGLALAPSDIQQALDRRRPGQSHYTTQRRESDTVEILSGVFEGKTTGAPIGLLIRNENARSADYANLQETFRPGHGDFSYHHKYGHRDYRGGGRASARETALRVAAGAIAQKYLAEIANIHVLAALTQMGPIVANFSDIDPQSCNNPFFCPDHDQHEAMAALIKSLRKEGDSIGARVRVVAKGLPIGLGEPIYQKLDSDIAMALMSINAVKGVSIGSGFDSVTQKGSEHRDEIVPEGFLSNHAGGVLAGISTGQPLIADIAIKPPSSILTPAQSLNTAGEAVTVSTKGRHDPCVGIRAVPVAQAMLALVIMDHWITWEGTRLRD